MANRTCYSYADLRKNKLSMASIIVVAGGEMVTRRAPCLLLCALPSPGDGGMALAAVWWRGGVVGVAYLMLALANSDGMDVIFVPYCTIYLLAACKCQW